MTIDLLYQKRWPKSSLARDIANMDVASYFQAYQCLKKQAPSRAKPYFGGRSGYPSTKEGKETNRREEHFAIAMVNAGKVWPLPDGSRFTLLDYQVPLQDRRTDRIGKIDMFGLTEYGRAVIIELKVISHSGGKSNAPPVALLEGLRYAAVVEANLDRMAHDICKEFCCRMVPERPYIMILGEVRWWSYWLSDPNIKSTLEDKAREISHAVGAHIVFASVTDTEVEYGDCTRKPCLNPFPKIGYPDVLPSSTAKPCTDHRSVNT